MSKAIKVLSLCYDRDRLTSAISQKQVEYIPNVFICRPLNCGPLAIFDSLENAKCFAPRSQFQFYICEYTPSKDNSLWFHDHIFERLEYKVKDFPKGTLFADSVKLIKPAF